MYLTSCVLYLLLDRGEASFHSRWKRLNWLGDYWDLLGRNSLPDLKGKSAVVGLVGCWQYVPNSSYTYPFNDYLLSSYFFTVGMNVLVIPRRFVDFLDV